MVVRMACVPVAQGSTLILELTPQATQRKATRVSSALLESTLQPSLPHHAVHVTNPLVHVAVQIAESSF